MKKLKLFYAVVTNGKAKQSMYVKATTEEAAKGMIINCDNCKESDIKISRYFGYVPDQIINFIEH